jgi:hypothetical protein
MNAVLCITANSAADVCYGSKADMCNAKGHVRFTPKSDWNVRYWPKADIERVSDELGDTRQNNSDFCELTRLCIDFDSTSVLLDDYVVADRESKAGAFTCWLGRKEWLEHLFFHVGRNTGAVIADPDFHEIAKAFGRSRECRFKVVTIGFRSALDRSIEAI